MAGIRFAAHGSLVAHGEEGSCAYAVKDEAVALIRRNDKSIPGNIIDIQHLRMGESSVTVFGGVSVANEKYNVRTADGETVIILYLDKLHRSRSFCIPVYMTVASWNRCDLTISY